MAETIYAVSDEAQRELADLRADLLRQSKFAVISTAVAKQRYWKRVREIMDAARKETHTDRQVIVRCPSCKKMHSLPQDVMRFECTCQPYVVLFTFQHRVITA